MAEGPDEIRQAIEETREEIGETVDALVAKADVKGRVTAKAHETVGDAREKVVHLADRAQSTARQPGPLIGSAPPSSGASKRPQMIAAGLAVLVLLALVRRRRRRS